jgi:hypothetical protein
VLRTSGAGPAPEATVNIAATWAMRGLTGGIVAMLLVAAFARDRRARLAVSPRVLAPADRETA